MSETGKLLTAEEVAERLRVRTRHVYEPVKKGELVGLRIGRYLRFDPADLPAYTEGQR
jgi:excisionase family DNA binding protein